MNKIYRIIHKSHRLLLLNNRIDLICDDGCEITNLTLSIDPSTYMSYLEKQFKYCDSIPKKNINNYFFINASPYKNQRLNNYKLIQVKQHPGRFYPRIYKPILVGSSYATNTITFNSHVIELNQKPDPMERMPYFHPTIIKSVIQLNTLIEILKSIFNTIYPTQNNYRTYGHNIRNLLILACTEVDVQFKGILIANGIPPKSDYYKMTDYIKLNKILQLEKYSIRFPYFPEIKPITPFSKWNVKAATKSLKWYNDYNAVKHNNEEEFTKASLLNSINSVAAVAILLIAQYGNKIPHWDKLIGNFFEITRSPLWRFEDCYIPPINNGKWIEEKLTI